MTAFLSQVPWERWKPKLLEVLPSYSRKSFLADLIAGLTVGLVALPLAIAFGIASGVTPQAGIYTAILGGLIVSLLGGSKLQIAGPTGAFVVIVATIVSKHGISGLLMVTMMAGVLLLFLGLTGLGSAVRFIPRPVVIGFTNGIALLIASTQIRDFLGMKMAENPSEFVTRVHAISTHLYTIDWPSCGLAMASVGMILLAPKVSWRIPGSIVAMLAGAFAVALFHLPVETIGSRFGGLSSGLPPLHIPPFRADLIIPLLPSAFSVAILAAVESLLSAVVADSLSGDHHNSNAELVAQGTANILVPLIGGIPVTGAIARTGTNFRAGAKTPVAGIVHSLTLLTIMMVFARFAKFIPLPTLAAVLLVVAYNIGEWCEIPSILKLDTAARSVWLITFVLTVVADLTVAVEVGMALASLLYIYRVSETTTIAVVTPEYVEDGRPHVLQDRDVPPYVTIVRIHGPFLFGTTDKLREETADLAQYARVVIVRLRNMTAIDATGLHELEILNERLKKSGRTMLLCGARRQPAHLLKRGDFIAHVGQEHILPHIQAALQQAERMHADG